MNSRGRLYRNLILPFAFIIIALSAIFIVLIYINRNNQIRDNNKQQTIISENRFNQLRDRDVLALNSVLKALEANDEIKELYLKKDKDALYDYTEETFREIREIYGITHWYFIGLDDKVFLRVHNKELSGDSVTRKTFLNAKKNKEMSGGLELGKTAFALRVVEPYYMNNELIGYMELGQEIDHFLSELSLDTNAKYSLVVDKNKINKEDYVSFVNQKGFDNHWEDSDKQVSIVQNYVEGSNEEAALREALQGPGGLGSTESDLIVKSGHHFSIGSFKVFDVDGIEVGVVYSIDNVTDFIEMGNRRILLVTPLLLLLMWVGFVIYSKLIQQNVTEPVAEIISQAEEAMRDDFRGEVKTAANYEVGTLAQFMNTLFAKIREDRKSIERKVLEQTQSIKEQGHTLEDQQLAVLNILEDIEEEKERAELISSELEKFKIAVEGASDHIVITDPEGYVMFANQGVEKITGFSPPEVVGKKAGSSDLWGGLMPTSYYQKMWQTIKKDKKFFSGVFRNKRKDGSEYDAATSISPILDAKGEVAYFVGVERDVTKEQDIDRAKTEFVSLASHQLRTPLSAINWYSEMLLNEDAGKITEEQKSYLLEIYKGNQRMVDLVNALLNVSRLELGTFEIKPELASVKEIVEDVLGELQGQIALKKQDISVLVDPKLPKIKVDKRLTRIIFQNLLSNAVKYTPNRGSIKISLKQGKKGFEFSVADNGYGIPKNQHDKIFSKLFRANNVRAMDTEGTGLGLYIIKSILNSAGGNISFTSAVGKGTTFLVEIPKIGMKEKAGMKQLD